jgi:hypothetical protein
MKLTKELIELQGFVHKETRDGSFIFEIDTNENLHELVWEPKTNNVLIFRFEDDPDDDDMLLEIEVFNGPIKLFIQFLSFLRQAEDITGKSISLPIDFIEKFKASRYPYSKEEFDEMSEVGLFMLLAKEEYEKINSFIEYRKRYYQRKKWEYSELSPDLFKTYSDITYDCTAE